VALKIVRNEDSVLLDQLEKEYNILQQLSHRGIVKTFDKERDHFRSVLRISFERIQGSNLS
jgi:hypothetical protein